MPTKPSIILIKKYGNRRLYDTTSSRYVNLDDLAAHIRAGRMLPLHLLCGGLPPEVAWPYVERAARAEALAASVQQRQNRTRVAADSTR